MGFNKTQTDNHLRWLQIAGQPQFIQQRAKALYIYIQQSSWLRGISMKTKNLWNTPAQKSRARWLYLCRQEDRHEPLDKLWCGFSSSVGIPFNQDFEAHLVHRWKTGKFLGSSLYIVIKPFWSTVPVSPGLSITPTLRHHSVQSRKESSN